MDKQTAIAKITELNSEKEVLFKEYTRAVKQWNKLQNEKAKQLSELGDRIRAIKNQVNEIQEEYSIKKVDKEPKEGNED
jgi:uncharacterized protein YukE